jgi:flavin-dependent dehydrogenase
MRDFDVAILGAGVIGLITAIEVTRSGRTAIVVTKRIPRADDPPRVDAVPAGLIALLAELGINPKGIGVDRLHDLRIAAWDVALPSASRAPKSAHVERPALELALLDRLVGIQGVQFTFERCKPTDDGRIFGSGWRAHTVIDATGRAAVTASQRRRPARPWVARTWLTSRRWCKADPGFAIAALPEGYAYRLGSSSFLCLGVVGRACVSGGPIAVEDIVRTHAPWLINGLPGVASMRPGAAGAASVQWTESDSRLRIGDAAVARDALSSQGLATGAAEAMLAAAVRKDSDLALLLARQREQRLAHFASLLQTIERCRFSASSTWRDYRTFVSQQIPARERASTAALRSGRIEAVSPRATAG